MKRFLSFVVEWKTYAALSYASSSCVVMAALWLMGVESIAIPMLFQLLLLSGAAALLSWALFTPALFRSMRYTGRLALFLVLFFLIVASFALLCKWLPDQRPEYWLTFGTIYLAVSLIMTLGYEIYFHISGNRYDGLLSEYRKRHGLRQDARKDL